MHNDSTELLVLRSTWPGTTIDGEPGIVSGLLSVYGDVDGGAYLNLAVGADHAPPDESQFIEFVLSPDQAEALTRALAGRPQEG